MKRIVSVCIVFLLVASGQALATTYYVDSINGNDDNSGTTIISPWQSLDKVNATTFAGGDEILFKAGDTWTGQLWPKGSGSDGSPIIIDKYGEGELPLLNGDGQVTNVVYLYNQEYWEISNLEITNYLEGDTSLKIGVCIEAMNFGTVNHIHLLDLVIHDINGDLSDKDNGGIFLEITGSSTETKFDDLLIQGCYIYDIDRTGISNKSSWDTRTFTANTNWYPSTNVVIKNNVIERSGNNGLIVRVCDGALIEHNLFRQCSLKGSGNASFPFNCDNTIIQYNEACYTVYNPGDVDASGFDSDYRCKNTIIQYNYSHDNDHGFVLVCCKGGETRFNDGTIVRYNISQNDGGNIFRISGQTTNTQIYNNIIYVGPGMSSRLIWHKSWQALPDGTNYYNNIFYNLGSGNYDFDGSTNDVFSHNIYYGNHPSREPNDLFKLTSNPMFVAGGTGGIGLDSVGGYNLQAGSPAIDSGMEMTGNGGMDYWGNPVPNKDTTDRGAHEWINTGPDTGPVTIFTDGFEGCFGNWTNGSAFCSSTHYEGEKSCKMDNSEYVETAVSTAGYSNILLNYVRNTSGLSPGDSFVSEWYDGSSWSTIEDITSGFSDWTEISYGLPAGAGNNAAFMIRFRVSSVSGNYAYVDSVSIVGSNCAGLTDFDCDGIVGASDLSYMASVWLTDDSKANIANPADSLVDLLDLSILSQEWLLEVGER